MLSLIIYDIWKILGTLGVWWGDVFSSHIYDGSHYEFNEWILPWM